MASPSLTLALCGAYFDAVLSGAKVEEYRLATPYWTKRLVDRDYARLILTRGYPKGGGALGVTRLEFQYRGCALRTITHPHFGPRPVLVYAIPLRA